MMQAKLWQLNLAKLVGCLRILTKIDNDTRLLLVSGKSLCKIPEIPGNATVRYRKFIKGKITKVGSKILFACKKGFVRRGARKIKCLKSGKWTSQPPTCEGNWFLEALHTVITLNCIKLC